MSKQRNYNEAEICLEKWVLWNSEHNGFPSRSISGKYGEMRAEPFEQSLPSGVEPHDRDIDRANSILSMMSGSSNKSAERAHILKIVTRERKEGDSISKTIERLALGFTNRHYYDAIEEFDIRLETMRYKKIA